jgi:hypothetical protein
MEENPCGSRICESCEQDRKDNLAETIAEQEKEIEELNKAIVARWELIKTDMGSWVDDIITDKRRYADDADRREGLIKSLNVMLNELGQQVGDKYDN